ncbi:MAG: hypothetical protein ABL879_18315, partial [Devosia sp.]
LPTWLGADRKAVAIKADGGLELSDSEAFAFADRVVSDAQGSGIVTDMAGVQRGANVYGLFTRFYSYANTTLQHNLEIVRREKHDAKDYAYATHDMIMTNIVPAIMLAAMKAAFTGGDGEDDDFLKAVGKELGSSLLGMVVGLREFSSAVQGYDYQGPSGLRFFASAYRLGEQTLKGEFGLRFWNAAIDTLGYGTGLVPSGQINRTLKGIDALTSGDTDRPTAVLFGPPK